MKEVEIFVDIDAMRKSVLNNTKKCPVCLRKMKRKEFTNTMQGELCKDCSDYIRRVCL